jgi:nucleoside-diphosphate-sugar epimerase
MLKRFDSPHDYIRRILERPNLSLDVFVDKEITIFGGTGFIGWWLSATIIEAMKKGLRCHLNIVARRPATLPFSLGSNLSKQVIVWQADLSEGVPHTLNHSDFYVLSSTSSQSHHGNFDESATMKSTKNITHFLEVLRSQASEREVRVVHLSSGIVYKEYGRTQEPFLETLDIRNEGVGHYQNAKIMIEKALYGAVEKPLGFKFASPRLFSLYGPGLPLNEHFAIGNFMRDALNGLPIQVLGHPRTMRSYLHVSDLVAVLLLLMVKPVPTAMNLGSESEISMKQLAEKVQKCFGGTEVIMGSDSCEKSYYVPSTSNARKELGVIETIEFEKGLSDWMDFLKR